jgi:pantetheine-phosphate adenylyltransferase
MKRIAFAGSFDPLTNGHMWVIKEGLKIAKEVLLFIAYNPTKTALFTIQEKERMILDALKEENIDQKVKVVVLKSEYAAYAALKAGCKYSLRGIRGGPDFDYESLIQQTNRDVIKGTKTLFVMPPGNLESVSSSYVKSLIGPATWHWKIKGFLPNAIYMAWLNKYVTKMVNEYMDLKCSVIEKQKFVDQIFEHYAHRPYHNIEHIVHCFQELEWAIANYNIPQEIYSDVALAIAAHDIIMGAKDSQKSDEELSALWLESFLKSIGQERPDSVNAVRSTEHLSGKYVVETEKEKLMNSIDLAILAQEKSIYKWYAKGVRKEYSQYSDVDYIKGRIQALNKLLSKPLYLSEYFAHYENDAIKNLQREINKLEKKLMKIEHEKQG